MENELKRIADALERIEARLSGASVAPEDQAVVTETVAETPALKVKKAKAKVEVEPVVEGIKTGAELMAYCNSKLVGVAEPARRAATIKSVVAMFKNDFGVSAIKEIDPAKIPAAKLAFDQLVEGE